MDSETPAQTAPLIADFNPYTKGDEIDWKKSPGNPFRLMTAKLNDMI